MDKFTVFNTLGEADVAASANAYAKALTEWKTQSEIPTDQIETAVEAVFDRNDGSLPMPALVSSVVLELSQDPNQFKPLSARVHAYVTGQKQIGRLRVKLGKGGGVLRVALPGQPIPAPVAKSA